MKDKLYTIWFVISTIGLVCLYLLFDRRGRDLSKLKAQAQFKILNGKLQKLEDKAQKSDLDLLEALEEYAKLVDKYPDVLGNTIFDATDNTGEGSTNH